MLAAKEPDYMLAIVENSPTTIVQSPCGLPSMQVPWNKGGEGRDYYGDPYRSSGKI